MEHLKLIITTAKVTAGGRNSFIYNISVYTGRLYSGWDKLSFPDIMCPKWPCDAKNQKVGKKIRPVPIIRNRIIMRQFFFTLLRDSWILYEQFINILIGHITVR